MQPVVVIGVTVSVESTIDGVASIGADARSVWLDLVSDVETVDVHQSVFDPQIGIDQFVEIDLDLQIAGLDPIDGIRTRSEGVQFVQLLAAQRMSLVTESVLDGFDSSSEVHLR